MKLKLDIQARKIAVILGLTSFLLAIVSLITEYIVEVLLVNEPDSFRVLILDLFSVNIEASIPTWFSVIILFVAAVLLVIIALSKIQSQSSYRLHWVGLAVIFVYLSMDEGATIHEVVANLTQNSLRLGGFFYFGWQVVAIPLVILLSLAYLRFVLHLPKQIRNLFVLAAALFVGGALIVEGISANQWYVDNGMSMTYLAIATVEELFEMLGVVVFIYALLSYIVQSEIVLIVNAKSSIVLETHESIVPPIEKARKVSEPNQSLLRLSPSLLIIAFLIATNIGLFTWIVNQNQQWLATVEPFYAPISEELAANDVLIVEMNSAFAIDDAESLQLLASLFSEYQAISVVNFPSENQSIIFAGDSLPFDRDSLTDLLHKNGLVEFVIFETPLLKAISSSP